MKQNVNYVNHHRQVNLKMSEDPNISPYHISVYNALFQIWNECHFDTDLSINRNDVMKLSKIGNANTYTRTLKQLNEYGYIKYKPSFNPLIGSKVTIIRFDKGNDKGSDKCTVKSSSKGTDKGGDTLYKQVNNKTIKQKNNKGVPPSFESFLNHAREKAKDKNIILDEEKVRTKFDSWLENDWCDLNGKKILNWKVKITANITYWQGSTKPETDNNGFQKLVF